MKEKKIFGGGREKNRTEEKDKWKKMVGRKKLLQVKGRTAHLEKVTGYLEKVTVQSCKLYKVVVVCLQWETVILKGNFLAVSDHFL